MKEYFKSSFGRNIKKCSGCKIQKEITEFHTKQTFCKTCAREYSRKWDKDPINKKRRSERNKILRMTPERRLKDLLTTAHIDRSKLSFEKLYNRLEISNFCCEITGRAFTYEARSPTGISIHRVDTLGEYTNDNVLLICWWLNAAMGNWGLDKLKDLLNDWER